MGLVTVVGSIPSPSDGPISLGPLELRGYGLMIALGVIAAVWLGSRRWAERGGDPEDISAIALWAVPAGVIGARLYHVITDWQKYQDQPLDALKIWQGGLGVPGGMALGVVVGLVVARQRRMRLPVVLDAVTPALPLAQAIGRWGNWFNQELFGGPTDLPWGLEIEPHRRPPEYAASETFHPTFLYESLWNLALCLALIRLDRSGRLRSGRVFAAYVMGYFVARLGLEILRVDTASLILGVRVNIWVSLIGIVVGGFFVITGWARPPRDPDSDEPYEAASDGPNEDSEGPNDDAVTER